MLSWLAKRLISYVMAHTRAGDITPTLRLDHPDVVLRFPGQSSWAGEFRGQAEVRRWLERFVAVGLQVYPEEVAVTGWPWRSTICIREGHRRSARARR